MPEIRKFRVLPATILLVAALGACTEPEDPNDNSGRNLQSKVNAWTTQMVADNKAIRSAIFAVGTRDGILASGADGKARADNDTPASTDHQFMIASISKTMVATRVLQLMESGHFELHTPIATLGVFPAPVIEKLHRINGVSYGSQITLYHLLTHTSGLRDYLLDDRQQTSKESQTGVAPASLSALWMAQLGPWLDSTPAPACHDALKCTHLPWPARPWVHWNEAAWEQQPDNRNAGLLNFFLSQMSDNALFVPGEGAHYSDTNYLLLGLLIEGMTGNSLQQELAEGIFTPLGMSASYLSYAPSAPPAGKRLSDWYAGDIPMISSGADTSWDWGGGGVVSTVDDLNTFIQALFQRRLYRRADTLQFMLDPIRLREDGATLTLGYGLGIRYELTPLGPMWGHSGAWGAQMQYFPEHGLSVVGTVNDYGSTQVSYRAALELATYGAKLMDAKLKAP